MCESSELICREEKGPPAENHIYGFVNACNGWDRGNKNNNWDG